MRQHNQTSYSYGHLLRCVRSARWPYDKGKPLNSAMRGYLRKDPDFDAPVVDIFTRKTKLATVYPDNIVEFTATPEQVYAAAQSLSQVLYKVLPCELMRFDKRRYKLLVFDDFDNAPRASLWERYSVAVKGPSQEYFQHLKLDLSTGKIVNTKDMTPVVNEEKRKQWLAGLKSFRRKLKIMARLGALTPNPKGQHGYIDFESQKYIADAIMRGDCDETCQRILTAATSDWRVRRSNKEFGDCVVDVFETLVKSNSREMRKYTGVIDIVK